MAAKPKTKTAKSLAELARQHGISRETLRGWRDSGLNVQDPTALAARIKAMPRNSTDETLAEAKRRRAVADADRAEIIARREAGEYVAWRHVHHAFTVHGAIIRAELSALAGYLPALLDGQRPEQMGETLKGAFHGLLTRLSQEHFCTDHPETQKHLKRLAELNRKNLCQRCQKTKET